MNEPSDQANMVQFHLLTAFPPHNVNRDEDGRPKTCQLGGEQRGRISSQAKKRALRFATHFPASRRATRTREAGIWAFRKLIEAGVDKESAVWTALAANFALGGGDKVPSLDEAKRLATPAKKDAEQRTKEIAAAETKLGIGPEAAERWVLEHALRTDQGLVVSVRELQRLEEGVKQLTAAWKADPAGFAAVLEAWVKRTCKSGLLTDTDHDLDTALFGRMVATAPNFNVEAACAISHAFTTHRFSVEGDYFSAGEELNELKETGAAITSYAFFGGGVYYQHAVLDRTSLLETLKGGRSEAEAEALEREAVGLLLDGLLLAQPKGKRNSFASDVAASYALVTRGADPALNLGLAFLDPVRPSDGTDLLQASIARLRQFHDVLREAYGLTNSTCIYNAYPPTRIGNAPEAPEVWTLEELRRFVLGGAS